MKIAFVYGAWALGGRFVDFDRLEESPRGLTGSETSCVEYACAMGDLGHDVSLYFPREPSAPNSVPWRGVRLRSDWTTHGADQGWDAVYAWNEPSLLQAVRPGALRMLNQQLNDFDYCAPGFDRHVDLYTSPSRHHLDFMRPQVPGNPDKWAVVPNGCDPTLYRDGRARVRGRVVWASSADRGLHLLLQMWPRIKRAAPHASLRCFYKMEYGDVENIESGWPADLLELGQRVRYIRYALPRLRRLDVEHCGSVSRARLRDEMAQAEILGYPCDTVRYTEGFSVSTLEACAAGALPVLGAADALPGIYRDSVLMTEGPAGRCVDEYVRLIVRALNDVEYRDWAAEGARQLAERFAYPRLARELADLVSDRLPKTEAAQ